MINNDMRSYNYFLFGDCDNYGQPKITEQPQGKIKLALYVISQSISDSAPYKDASYLGITFTSTKIDDSFIIDNNGEKLKVLYIVPHGIYKQIFLQLT